MAIHRQPLEQPLATAEIGRPINQDAPPDHRASVPGWTGLAGFCIAVLVGATAMYATIGIPGSTGGTSPSQQQASHVPQPTLESTFGNAGTTETTGHGAPVGARPPRQ